MRTPAQVLAEDPTAEPPIPPGSRPASTRPAQVQSGQRIVAANGKITVHRHHIQLGAEHARRRVHTVTDGDRLSVFDPDGQHLRTVQLDPNRRYYGNGQPRGRRKAGAMPRVNNGQAPPAPAPPARAAEAPESRAAEGRRAATDRPLTPEGRPITLRGIAPARPCPTRQSTLG